MEDGYNVSAIEAVVGGGSKFVLAQNSLERLILTSTSTVVQAAVLGALLVGGKVNIETYAGTQVIKRVPAFERGNWDPIYGGEYTVNRVATQRGRSGGADHLEVIVVRNGEIGEKAYNVYDPLLQQLVMAAFQHKHGFNKLTLSLGIQDGDLFLVRLGES